MIRDYVHRLQGQEFIDRQAAAWLEIRDWVDGTVPIMKLQTGGSVNGPGSSLPCTEAIREVLPRVLAAYGVGSMLDAPCGDWAWMSQVELPVHLYVGWDVDPVQIERNKEKYGSAGRHFMVCNILTADRVPKVDAILCRDFLAHLPTEHISAVLDVFARSGTPLLLASNYPGTSNDFEYHPEHFAWLGYMERPVNLEAHPFGLRKINAIAEDPTPGGVNSGEHELGVFLLNGPGAHTVTAASGEQAPCGGPGACPVCHG